jgi:hypothetical protein
MKEKWKRCGAKETRRAVGKGRDRDLSGSENDK